MIEVKDCVMDYYGKRALDGVTLTVPDGCSYGLLGSNAAGKSTLLKIMNGIYRPTSGSVLFDGKPVYDSPAVKEQLFFVDDETVQFNNMTLRQLKSYYKTFYTGFSDAIFGELIGKVGLPENKPLHTFSKGMKRQSAVICGVSCGTRYLFIDEAFDGLDEMMRTIVKNVLIDAMLDRKVTVVFSSHNLSEIDEFCDRVGLLHGGRILFDRALDSIKDDIIKVRAAFDREVTAADFPELEVLHTESSGSLTYIIARGGPEKIRASVEKLSPKIYDEMRLTLKEIFIYEMEGVGYDSSGLGSNAE
ncbi:MAG: ABC transporter ATP-binding protein [Ruminiclostridium sp.]|nr:ABC transporter ATP-binding protein [Ruminiclostridium sp.]